ncbi:MAG: glycosyltransferase family A protein [Methylotenera sp.]|nr:glycosyltransferase family A protein [Methylotenera sp.]
MQPVHQSVKSMQALLTIAIPTYNRATYLNLCLSRLSEELDRLNDDHRKLVRVYVSNNASTDNTSEVISRYLRIAVVEFEVVINAENIGGELNVAQCYSSATTPYVWILGDDDVVLPGGLDRVLNALFHGNVDLLYLNNYWFIDDYTAHLSSYINHNIVIYKSALEFARSTNVMLTFISGLIVRTSVNLRQYSSVVDGCNLPQMGWVLPLLRDGKCFATIEDWVVAAKGSNSGGYGLVKVFGSNLVRITNEILKDKPDIARAIQNGTIVNFFPSFILDFRKGNSQFADKDMGVGLKEAYGDNWRYYVFLAPLIRLPLFVANYYHVFLKVIRRLFHSAFL